MSSNDLLPNVQLPDDQNAPNAGAARVPTELPTGSSSGSLLLRANVGSRSPTALVGRSPLVSGASPLGASAAPRPSGHPPITGGDVSVCPFALIQAALESQTAGTAPPPPVETQMLPPKPNRPMSAGSGKHKASEILSGFVKSSLDETAIPESLHVPPSKLQQGLQDGLQGIQYSTRGSNSSPKPSGSLMCPVSGAVIDIAGDAREHPEDALARMAKVDKDESEGGSRAGGSRAGSKQGSRQSGSKTGSRKSGSKATSSKARNKVRRRVKKTIKFSEWEADTYIPQIKESWAICMRNTKVEQVGLTFLDTYLAVAPDLAHMFTSAREVLSVKFSEMLTSIVASVDNPAALHEQLKGLAPMHLKLGVKKEYLPKFGETLVNVISGNLKDEFTEQYRAAWEWLWSWLSQSMTQSLEEASNEATILSQSWDMAMDNCPGNEFGEMLFDVLFELAPNMKTLFNKPKQILSVKFMEMLSTLVSFNGDAKRMAEQSVWLGMRHVRYGARPQHIQVLGQVVVTCLERAVGDEWTAEMDRSWTELWQQSCSSMLKVTMEAEKHGEVVRELWEEAKQRTTCQKFGSSLRKMLLSGTEWVQGLSAQAAVQKEEDGKEGKEGKGDTSQKKKPMRGSVSEDQGSAQKAPIISSGNKEPNATFNDKSSDADAIGTQFWEMLTVLLDLLWEPEQMNERLTVTTHHFFSLGIRSAHLDTIGMAIHTTLERVMGASWQQKHSDAWKWFWGMVSTQMQSALDVLESGDVEIIRSSWEEAKSSKPAEELGEIFFKELARIAPHVTHLFKRPKRIQALQFTNVIEMLVGFNEDPDQFFKDLKPLTIRHIKYGVKADYARAFGMTVLNGISSVLGDKFDERVKSAWVLLWTRVSSCVTRSLNVGSNLVIVSLVQENLEQLEDAMDCVPRGERDEVLTKIDVNGEIISPLMWAINGGQLDMAKFVMGDLLAIRADRYRYYYGREVLFKTHPDLVQSVARQMPALLDNLFDGLMWHAQMVQDGRVRVNYYIREMYAVPEEVVDVWTSPMGVLVLAGQSVVFNHPVIEKLLEVKWERFGFKLYAAIQIWYMTLLVLFTFGFVVHQNSCLSEYVYARQVVGAMATLTLFLQTGVLLYQYRSGQVSRMSARIKRIPDLVIPRFLMNPWNAARYVSSAMLIANAYNNLSCLQKTQQEIEEHPERPHGLNVLGAVTAIFIWLQLIQVLILSERMAAFTYTVGRMVTDFVQNFSVIVVVIVAFGSAMTMLEAPGGYKDGLDSSIFNLLKLILGLAPHDAVDQESWAMACLVVVTIIVNIGFLNILVAQLVLAYSLLSTDQEGCAKMNRAYICVEMESFLSLKYRQALFGELRFDEPLEFDSSDEGPCGGIQSLCPSTIRSHPKYVPDRVQRFTGEASVMDPWPSEKQAEMEEEAAARNDDDYAVD